MFRDYGESGTGTTRHYVHDDEEAKLYGAEPGTFTEWGQLPEESDLLFYEGLHGAVVTDKVNIAQYADLKIGVVPSSIWNGSRSCIATAAPAAIPPRR